MLVTCSDCQHRVSERAATCPGCGAPLLEAKGPLTLIGLVGAALGLCLFAAGVHIVLRQSMVFGSLVVLGGIAVVMVANLARGKPRRLRPARPSHRTKPVS